jgi:hypothetical protein
MDPETPIAGDIRLAEAAGERRAVLVLQIDGPIAAVCLLGNETELGCDRDVLIAAGETSGLSYALLAELDLRMPVLAADLGPRLGQLRPSLAAELERSDPGLRRAGLALRGPADPRWGRKLEGLRWLAALGAPAMRLLLD